MNRLPPKVAKFEAQIEDESYQVEGKEMELILQHY